MTRDHYIAVGIIKPGRGYYAPLPERLSAVELHRRGFVLAAVTAHTGKRHFRTEALYVN